jgi:hypothetical protein
MAVATQLTVRIPNDLHTKARILSFYKKESLNAVILESLKNFVQQWEQTNGPIPIPPSFTGKGN